MPRHSPYPYGTRRADIYLRAAVDLPRGSVVRLDKRGSIRPVRSRRDVTCGVTLRPVTATHGVWVRYLGPVRARMHHG